MFDSRQATTYRLNQSMVAARYMNPEAIGTEDVYIRGYDSAPNLCGGLGGCFDLDNHARLHQALGYRTPAAVHAMPVPGDRRLSPPASEG